MNKKPQSSGDMDAVVQEDDTYLLVGARELDVAESTAAQRMIEGGRR